MAHNRNSRVLLSLSVALLLTLAGCSKNEPSSTTTTSQPAATPAAQAPASAPAAAPAAPAANAIQSQNANEAGVVGDLTECKRADGVLTVKILFRNTTAQKVGLSVIEARDFDKYYVTAGDKKYFVLKDSEGTRLMPEPGGNGYLTVGLAGGQGWLFWAKFPAPPAEVKKITLVTPITPPYEDVPISDK